MLCAGIGLPLGFVGAVSADTALREVERPADVAPGQLVATPEGLLHVGSWGAEAEGPWVVLIHGSAAWSGVWEPVAKGLEARGHRVVALDLPPFGYSERPADGRYDRPSQARRVWAALDALGAEEVVLVGHSFGAGPVVEAAMQQPERTVGVALVAGALSLGKEPGSLGPLGWGPLATLTTASTFTQPRLYPTVLRSMVHDPVHIDDTWVRRYTRPLSVAGTTPAVAAWLPELMAPTPCDSLDEEAYRSLQVPFLLVAGQEDRVTPVPELQHVDGLLPRSTMVVLPDVGHRPRVEPRVGVVAHVDAFVRGL